MIPFNILNENLNGLNYISYLNETDSGLYLQPIDKDFTFGSTDVDKDVIEFGVYDIDKNLLILEILTGSYTNKKVNYQYVDTDGNSFVDYYYQSTGNFIQDKDKNLLFDISSIITDLINVSSSLTASLADNFYVSVNPVINKFSVDDPLVIKEISNSRKEIKLVKSFNNEFVENVIYLTFSDQQILLNGSTNINLKAGIVHRIIVQNGDFDSIGFSLTRDGTLLAGGTEYTTNIIFKKDTSEIILDTTEVPPKTLWIYNKLVRGNGCSIFFTEIVNTQLFQLNTEFISLDSEKFIHNQIHPLMESYLGGFDVTTLYNSTKDDNINKINSLKRFFGLSSDSGVYDLLTTIYYGEIYYDNSVKRPVKIIGIQEYILNYLKFNHEFIGNFSDLSDQINRINVYSVDAELYRKNPNAFSTRETKKYYSDSLSYLTTIFNTFLLGCQASVKQDFTNKFEGPLRNSLNFGNNNLFQILNSRINYSDINNLQYIVKLKDALASDYDVGSTCNVSNITFVPFFQKINYNVSAVTKTVRLLPPNFSVETFDYQPSISKKTKYYNSVDLEISSSHSQDINNNKAITQFNIDFTDFSNFIVFSSAHLRVKIFENKIIKMTLLDDAQLSSSYAGISPSAYTQKDGYNNIITLPLKVTDTATKQTLQKNEIIDSFDQYESYLYKQYTNGRFVYDMSTKTFIERGSNDKRSPSYKIPSSFIDELETNASQYDRFNRDSLVNSTPEFVFEDDRNDEYLKFLSMVGHHFDNIYLYISNMNMYKQIGNDIDNGLPRDFIGTVLNSFGLNPPSLTGNTDDVDILSMYLNNQQNSGSFNAMSLNDMTKTVWKRILSNLPAIYKAKGTGESVKYILSCYGIPENMILLKEFGGGYTESGIESWYGVSENMYYLQYMGNDNEYVRLDNLIPYKSVDLKFAVSDTDYMKGNIIELYSKFNSTQDQIFSFGIIKDTDYNGMFYVILKDANNEFGYVTDKMTLFDDDITGVLLRKNEVDSHFENASENSYEIPVKYDIVVSKKNSTNTTASLKEFSFYLSSSFNEIFDTNNINMFGNVQTSYFITEYSDILDQYLFRPEIGNEILFTKEGNLSSVNNTGSWFMSPADVIVEVSQKKFIGVLDKFTFNTTPISNQEFYTKMVNLNSYADGDPSNSDNNTLFRFDLGYPIDISYSSSLPGGYIVNNKNSTYNNISASLAYFTGNNNVTYFDSSSCSYISNLQFPYQTRLFEVINEYNTSEVGPNRFENDKVNKTSLISNTTTLSPNASLHNKSLQDYKKDTNKYGIFMSPVYERDRDILDFYGTDEIISLLANPYDRMSSNFSYESLDRLRKYYYGINNDRTRILFNELFTMYKIYIDKSIFQTLKSILPGRNKIYSGILIEPSILERNKIPDNGVSIENETKLESNTTSIHTENGLNIGTLDVNTISQSFSSNYSYVDNSFSGFNNVDDVPDEFQLGTFCEVGSGLTYYKGSVYQAYNVISGQQLYLSSGNKLTGRLTKKSKKLGLLPIGYTPPSNYTPFTSSNYYNNLTFKNICTRKEIYIDLSNYTLSTEFVKSRQTALTTINDISQTGGQTNRSPIISTVVGGQTNNSNIVNPFEG